MRLSLLNPEFVVATSRRGFFLYGRFAGIKNSSGLPGSSVPQKRLARSGSPARSAFQERSREVSPTQKKTFDTF